MSQDPTPVNSANSTSLAALKHLYEQITAPGSVYSSIFTSSDTQALETEISGMTGTAGASGTAGAIGAIISDTSTFSFDINPTLTESSVLLDIYNNYSTFCPGGTLIAATLGTLAFDTSSTANPQLREDAQYLLDHPSALQDLANHRTASESGAGGFSKDDFKKTLQDIGTNHARLVG